MQGTDASHWLARYARKYSDIWQRIDTVARSRGKRWDSWCFVPVGEVEELFSVDGRIRSDIAAEAPILATLAAWRHTQGVYSVDPDLLGALLGTPVTRVPVDVLMRLPEWSVYVRLSDYMMRGLPVRGMFVALDDDRKASVVDLMLLLDAGDLLLPIIVPLERDSLDEALEALDARILADGVLGTRASVAAELLAVMPKASELMPLLSVALYLGAEDADLRDASGMRARPVVPSPKLVMGKWQFSSPARPTTWNCGSRIGAELRRAKEADIESAASRLHASPRPHIRVAHWHTYRVGPGRRDTRIKWLHPILVSANDEEVGGIVSTVRPVRSRGPKR